MIGLVGEKNIHCTKNEEILKGGLSGLRQFLARESSLMKNDEKCFLFHLKSSFRSQDI